MVSEGLWIAAVLGSGLAAGVLFAVAVSIVPALRDLPPDRYIQAHQLLGRNWDPVMPIIVLGATVADALLALFVGTGASRVFFATGAALLLGSALVSQFRNVPLNREVKRLDPHAGPPPGWRDPRPQWRRWHLVRTSLAGLAFVANAVVAVGY
jgi:uncharacterized membrane protein